jgi:diadenosine tetraphosphatase ApaH/serine/threonine PP2A family protein phosphatase
VSAPGDHDVDTPCIVNPGSVGQARDGKTLARYAVLDPDRRTVSFREIPYDHESTLRKLREAGLVPQVVLTRPKGRLGRLWERWKTGRARRRAER